jgi:hypothetical protein
MRNDGRPQSELMKLAVTLIALPGIAQMGSMSPVASGDRNLDEVEPSA